METPLITEVKKYKLSNEYNILDLSNSGKFTVKTPVLTSTFSTVVKVCEYIYILQLDQNKITYIYVNKYIKLKGGIHLYGNNFEGDKTAAFSAIEIIQDEFFENEITFYTNKLYIYIKSLVSRKVPREVSAEEMSETKSLLKNELLKKVIFIRVELSYFFNSWFKISNISDLLILISTSGLIIKLKYLPVVFPFACHSSIVSSF